MAAAAGSIPALTLAETLDVYARAREVRMALFTTSLSTQQAPFKRDYPAKGSKIVARVVIPGDPAGEVERVTREAVGVLGGAGDEVGVCEIPGAGDVEAEWVGLRPGVGASEGEMKGTEKERYGVLMEAATNDVVMLYAHGGAGCIGSAAASRNITATMAALTGGRVLSINYRLLPQNPFPASLMDLFLAYFYLLYPPPGSFHAPVPASKIVFIGDSFGGTLALALTQLILSFNSERPDRTLHLLDRPVTLPVPAALALVSPYSYGAVLSMPSATTHFATDTFPPFSTPPGHNPFFFSPAFPSCSLWPTSPPRGDVYCSASMLSHPLVSPGVATSWRGCPPVYMAVGDEACVDSVRGIATRIAADADAAPADGAGAGTVVWEEYEAMCHVWMSAFPKWRQSRMVYERWARFVVQVTSAGGRKDVKTKGTRIEFEGLKELELDVRNMPAMTVEETLALIEQVQKERGEEMARRFGKNAML